MSANMTFSSVFLLLRFAQSLQVALTLSDAGAALR